MDCESIMSSEIGHTQKDNYCMIALKWGTDQSDLQRPKEEWCARSWVGGGELLFNGGRTSVLQDAEGSGDWLHNSVNILDTTQLHT